MNYCGWVFFFSFFLFCVERNYVELVLIILEAFGRLLRQEHMGVSFYLEIQCP